MLHVWLRVGRHPLVVSQYGGVGPAVEVLPTDVGSWVVRILTWAPQADDDDGGGWWLVATPDPCATGHAATIDEALAAALAAFEAAYVHSLDGRRWTRIIADAIEESEGERLPGPMPTPPWRP